MAWATFGVIRVSDHTCVGREVEHGAGDGVVVKEAVTVPPDRDAAKRE